MGYIPEDTEWFVAELIMEIIVHGASRNVVHRNLILIRAAQPEVAYQRACYWGNRAETCYENPLGQSVEIKFRGISKLDVVVDPLIDGGEVYFEESVGVTPEQLASWIVPKEQLQAFKKPPSFSESHDPCYSSKAIVDEVNKRIAGHERKGSRGKPTDDLDVHREPLRKPLNLIRMVGEIALIRILVCFASY